MAAARPIKEILAGNAAENFIGRASERAALLASLEDGGALVTYLHGVAGSGKSALLDAFANEAGARGAMVVRLDCRFIEPTEEGFCAELARVLGKPVGTAEEAATEMERPGATVVLILDSYDVLRLIESWIRQRLIPALGGSVRVVLSGRHQPGPGWLLPLEWKGLFQSIALPRLSESESLEFLRRDGVEGVEAERISRLSQGHPLTLRLAAQAARRHSAAELESTTAQAVVQQLSRLFLNDVDDALTKRAIEAASVVRRATRPLLAAMMPGISSEEAYERLAAVSFVESTPEGLMLHGAVQEAVASSLQGSDPRRFRAFRRAAWRHLQEEARAANRQEMWRYTADMLYLVQTPFVREAFFPSGAQELSIEPATTGDGAAILAIARHHETEQAAAALARWWEACPQVFHVAKSEAGEVIGFYMLLQWEDAGTAMVDTDPLARNWRRHMREHPVGRGQTAVYLRRWLSASCGEAPSAIQAACWLDVKRSYARLRPRLRRCYISVSDLATYAPAARLLGFQVVEEATVHADGVPHHLVVLDFGPDSIDGWLAGLVAQELELEQDDILDADARELVIDGRRAALTELEFGVLRLLREQEGKVVSRADLLSKVWANGRDSSSNVVDVVVRSLRGKMGEHASMIATVRGSGYRLRVD